EWVHVQLHQQKGMISLSPPTICNSAAGPRSWGGCWASFTASLPRTWSRKRAIPTKWPRRARSP
ncbi:hypothetical protein EIA00_23870, partial [Escherichia coli]